MQYGKLEFQKASTRMPRNGLLLWRGQFRATVVSETKMDRSATVVEEGSATKTYALPPTTLTVRESAFTKRAEL